MRLSREILCGFALLFIVNVLYAQTDFPAGDFWSFSGGIGMSNILVDGLSYQLIIEPKLWLSPPLIVGSKAGINYSTEENTHDILAFEGQVFLRWNFLRFGNPLKTTKIFLQGGLGLLAAYRGDDSPFDDVTMTRGSVLADAAFGVTIPLTSRWHIEPSVRAGYPHIIGVSVTAGYKFKKKKKTISTTRTEYVEIIRTVPPNEIIKRVMINAVEFVLFGPDTGSYNEGIDYDARQLNEMVLDHTAEVLKENPTYRVRIEGHVNPITVSHYEIDEIMVLGAMRADSVADQLRARGVDDEQMVVISFGGARIITSEYDIRNRNRRVELILIQFDTDE
jgi:outer membrane protein OmpA-like peptidoglycan-associated protein